VTKSDLRRYTLESTHQVDNRHKRTRAIRDVFSMSRKNGIMYFRTLNDGIIRRNDADWNLVGIAVQKVQHRY